MVVTDHNVPLLGLAVALEDHGANLPRERRQAEGSADLNELVELSTGQIPVHVPNQSQAASASDQCAAAPSVAGGTRMGRTCYAHARSP